MTAQCSAGVGGNAAASGGATVAKAAAARSERGRMRAGIPTAMELAGRSVTTTALAPIETSFADGDVSVPGATSAAAKLAI
jgi:hypothetical protein